MSNLSKYQQFLYPLILFSIGLIIYANSFYCAFQLDDLSSIIDNSYIRNINDIQKIWNYLPRRFLLYLSLAFNYQFFKLNVLSYHLINILIHLLTTLCVGWLFLLTLSTPKMKNEKIAQNKDFIAFLAALVFVTHPIQTEAVTYIIQRAASLATLFYIASLCLYIKTRLEQETMPLSKIWIKYYIASLIMAVFGLYTKEITITLPIIIALYELYFLNLKQKPNWKMCFPFFLTLPIIPFTIFITESPKAFLIRGMAPSDPPGISWQYYLLTEFRVIITYIRLLFIPINQNLDYDYTIFKSLFQFPVLLSILAIVTCLYSAKKLFLKHKLLSFSILWFFVTLIPESSFFPIHDVIFEHRLYLPMVGFSIFIITLLYTLFRNRFYLFVFITISMVIFNSILTFQRNITWQTELSLLNDIITKSPNKERSYNNRGLIESNQGRIREALEDYNEAIKINSHYLNAYINRGFLLHKIGKLNEALKDFNTAISINSKFAEAFVNRGNVYADQENFLYAIADYNNAIAIKQNLAQAYNCRANIYFKLNQWEKAINDYNKACVLEPTQEIGFFNLGITYYKLGLYQQAILNFNKAIALNPNDLESLNNRAICYYQLKEFNNSLSDIKTIKLKRGTPNKLLIKLLHGEIV